MRDAGGTRQKGRLPGGVPGVQRILESHSRWDDNGREPGKAGIDSRGHQRGKTGKHVSVTWKGDRKVRYWAKGVNMWM